MSRPRLIRLTIENNIKEAKVLIETTKGVLNEVDGDGWTALIHAAYCGRLEMLQLLVESGADLNIRTTAGWTALMWAEKRRQFLIYKILVGAGADTNLVAALPDNYLPP